MKTTLSKNLKQHIMMLLFVTCALISCKKENGSTVTPPTTEAAQISSISPKNPQPGDIVIIAGTGFGATATDVKVTIGATQVTIASVTNTEIKFAVPAGLASGTLALLIKGTAAVNKDPQGGTITVTPKATATPTFTAMQPATGKTGDVITLTGTGFNPQASENKVFFATTTGGTVVLATVKTASATQLTVEVPANVITGGVLITVSGTNAVPATGFNTTFTATTTTGTGGVSVSYINAISGALNFSKIATASKEIGAMTLDRANNVIYYSDYTILNQVDGQNTVYKVGTGGTGAPTVLTTDARIGKIIKVTTDAAGNVYVLKYEAGPSTYSVYKITADGATVTEVIKSFEMYSSYSSQYFFFINAANEICIRPGFKISPAGAILNTESKLIGIQQKDGGAILDGNSAYLSQNTDNNSKANNIKFIKWNLAAGAITDAGFTVSNLFGTDDASLFSTGANISYLKYTFDSSNNMYALMDHSYISGQTSKTWMLRKYNTVTNTSTLMGTFLIKFPSVDLNDYNSALEFVGDANGNLFFKANIKDIIMIKQ
jgi:hypothetical protein